MTDHRQLLELAALAIDRNFVPGESWDEGAGWNPLENSGDSHDMCAALVISTRWLIDRHFNYVGVSCDGDSGKQFQEWFADHNNDRSAAWRLAALRVAAEIGKGMRG